MEETLVFRVMTETGTGIRVVPSRPGMLAPRRSGLTMLMTDTGKSYDQIEFSILLSMLDNLYDHV